MITHIEIERFKSLQKVSLDLGHFNLFVGTNASGKSNFLDALHVLQGIGYGFTVDEIFNGKPKSAGSEVWEPIRGGSAKAEFIARDAEPSSGHETLVRLSVHLKPDPEMKHAITYSIGLSPRLGCVRSETLSGVFDSSPIENTADSPVFQVRHHTGRTGRQRHLTFEKSRPVLHQLMKHEECIKEHKETIGACIRALSNMQRLDPSPAILRDYSRAPAVTRMGERGENFAALVKTILADPKPKSAYLSWLVRLTPIELDDIMVLSGALGEPLFAIKERGVDYPAPILSDGTLRFAAVAAAFFQPDMPDLLTIEEVENSIHPSRLRLLVELLKSQSRIGNRQLIATTHSPIVLAWLREGDGDYATTFFCKRDEDTGASVIAPLCSVPSFQEIVRKHPIGDLFAEGWLEGAL